MTGIFRKIGILLTAFLLIAATGGYSIYRHICNCEGAIITSVFLVVECEHGQQEHAQSCCDATAVEKSCCGKQQDKSCERSSNDGDCCHTNTQFFKIDDSFNAGQEINSFKVYASATTLIEKEVLLKEEVPQPVRRYISDASPPPSGKQILLEIHQLKLAPELG